MDGRINFKLGRNYQRVAQHTICLLTDLIKNSTENGLKSGKYRSV